MMDRLSSGNRIYDVYFNTCYRKCMSSNRDYYLFNFLRAVALAIFLLIDIFALHSQSYLAQLFLGLSIGYNLVNTLKAFIFEKVYLKDEGKILAFAM